MMLAGRTPVAASTYALDLDAVDETGVEKFNIFKEETYTKVFVGVGIPVAVVDTLRKSKKKQMAEKKRVKDAIARMEIMRDEFMDVQGEAESDDDIFASLRERSEEIEEAEAEGAAETAAQERARAAARAKDAANEAALLGYDEDGGRIPGVFNENDKGEGPSMASDEDVERLKRMFGSVSPLLASRTSN